MLTYLSVPRPHGDGDGDDDEERCSDGRNDLCVRHFYYRAMSRRDMKDGVGVMFIAVITGADEVVEWSLNDESDSDGKKMFLVHSSTHSSHTHTVLCSAHVQAQQREQKESQSQTGVSMHGNAMAWIRMFIRNCDSV